jgi:hypothetical protein
LCRRLARAGLPRQPSEGPLDYAHRAAARWPQCKVALRQVGEAYAALRYGPGDAANAESVAALRAGIAALPTARRLRDIGDD